MDHRVVLKAIEAYTPVEDMKRGYLHMAKRGNKVVYWVSQYAHAGEVVHTGMFTRTGAAVEHAWADPITALQFLGFMPRKGKARK
jgi:hypothetical protein